MTQSLDFARLMASRLCHDLVSPLSAVSNGLEIFEEETDPEMQKRALELAYSSLKVANDRLCCFRMAWGAAMSMPSFFTAEMLKDLLAPVLQQHKTTLLLNLPEPVEKKQGQILLCMALVAMETLHRGGEILLSAESSGGFSAKATAKRVRLSDRQQDLLTNSALLPEEAREMNPVFLRLLAEENAQKLIFSYEADSFFKIDLQFSCVLTTS